VERSTACIPSEKLSQPLEDSWAQEIRDYLLGRVSSKSRTEVLESAHKTELPTQPVRHWWIFEGKQYRVLDGTLAENWDFVVRNASRLSATFNPRLRLSDRPDGIVDWGQTLARGPHRLRQEYVVRSSGIGLDEEEQAALWGWMRWIAKEWYEYTHGVAIQSCPQWPDFAIDEQNPSTPEQLRRWAHVSRRSRWPLLHGVVAESLRPFLEPEELDRIPLPADRAKLFELLCLVRVARCVAPSPRKLRWLNADNDDNTIKLDGVRVFYQQSLHREVVLATGEYAGSLAHAVEFFGVGIPRFIDLAFDFETSRANFDGLIIEAKSGAQQYEHTVAQLRTYRLARFRRLGSRYLIWGIVEKPDRPDATFAEFHSMFAAADKTDDVWVFSSADAIPTVLSAILGTKTQKSAP
jgi:hypothetical protein